MSRSRSNRPSVVPGVLVLVGLVGLGLAAASELDLTWNDTFQAGVVEVQADCQTGPIGVSFSEPTFTAASADAPWTTDEVTFTGISTACHGLDYQAAYRIGGDWVPLDGVTAQVGATVVASLDGVDPQDVTEFALTIQGSAATAD
jgi:hypothetical protein